MKRTAGILIPLFSIRSDNGWGVGEYPDLSGICPFLNEARLPLLMVLPLVEAALGQDSPYAAMSAFALDPIYIRLDDVQDFRDLGGEGAFTAEEKAELDKVRKSRTVDYGAVRALKEKHLRRAFDRFHEWGAAKSDRVADLENFRAEQKQWLAEYTLFRALKESYKRDWWRNWAPELRDRKPAALKEARERLSFECSYYEYLQWQAFRQLGAARKAANQQGILLAGDLPFMVAEDSADVWARQDEFRFEETIGVPPDAFSADGQDWGLPVYRWDVIAARGFDWLKLRGARTAEMFDLVRVDHVVGFYRTYARPRNKKLEPFFLPPDEPSQIVQGEAVLKSIREGGAEVVAEDLGVVPPFVRKSLTAIGVPGYRVQRWEQDAGKFRDPEQWPALSLATTGTHDSEPLSTWWEALPSKEKAALSELPTMKGLTPEDLAHFSPQAHEKLLETVYCSGSALLVLPVQDVFGTRERINLPGTVSADNWSYRMPWTLAELATDPFVRGRVATHAALAKKFHRE